MGAMDWLIVDVGALCYYDEYLAYIWHIKISVLVHHTLYEGYGVVNC